MQHDVAKKHADTLTEWAEIWQRDAQTGQEGAGDVAFLLARAARSIRVTLGLAAPPREPVVEAPDPPTGEIRAG